MNDEDNGLLTIDELRSLAWKPLHMATDCVLDMMTQLQVDLQAQADRVKKSFFCYIQTDLSDQTAFVQDSQLT